MAFSDSPDGSFKGKLTLLEAAEVGLVESFPGERRAEKESREKKRGGEDYNSIEKFQYVLKICILLIRFNSSLETLSLSQSHSTNLSGGAPKSLL